MKKLYFILLLTTFAQFVAAQTEESGSELRVGGGATFAGQEPIRHTTHFNPTRTLCRLHGFRDNFVQVPVNALGSRTDRKVDDPTGFFHVRKIDGRWWAIDPEGYYFIHKGVTSIRPGAGPQTPGQIQAFQDKWGGNVAAWVEDVKSLLKEYNFTGIGGFSNDANFRTHETEAMPYTAILNFRPGFRAWRIANGRTAAFQFVSPAQSVYVFDPEWPQFAMDHARMFAERNPHWVDDPMLFGLFSDNEIYFQTMRTDMLREYLLFPVGDPNRDATDLWLRNRLGLAEDDPVPAYDDISTQVRNEFLYYAGKRYYRYVAKALRTYFPNHMILGSRNFTQERNNEWFMKSQRGYVDVMSVNYYNVWTPNMELLHNWERWTDAPLIIGEFYTKAMDSGLPNIGGAGWVVATQTCRGLFYQNYTLALLQSGTTVGWHWFRYQDNEPPNDNDDSNKGIVDNNFEPWVELLEHMREINANVYNIIDFFDKRRL